MSRVQARPGTSKAPQRVRIIAGQWKRLLLPVADLPGLRPTPDRVRETVFNWLNHLFDGLWQTREVLDLFAGSGALGFEAASRGAKAVLMVEQAAAAVAALNDSARRLQAAQVQVVRADAKAWLRQVAGSQFDLVFLDPPYTLDLLPSLLPACRALLKPEGLVYAESDKPFPVDEEWLQGWEAVRMDRAGAVHFCLLQCKKLA